MIPVGAGLIDLEVMRISSHADLTEDTYIKLVLKGLPRCNSTLTCPNRPVHVGSTILIKAVEVKTCGSVAKLVVDVDYQAISHRGHNRRDRPLPIDAHNSTLESAIRVSSDPTDIEVIGYRGSTDDSNEKRKGAHGDQHVCNFKRVPSCCRADSRRRSLIYEPKGMISHSEILSCRSEDMENNVNDLIRSDLSNQIEDEQEENPGEGGSDARSEIGV